MSRQQDGLEEGTKPSDADGSEFWGQAFRGHDIDSCLGKSRKGSRIFGVVRRRDGGELVAFCSEVTTLNRGLEATAAEPAQLELQSTCKAVRSWPVTIRSNA